MARELGRYFRVYAGDAASPEVFTVIAGQDSLNRSGSTNLVDQSNKSDYPYAIQAPGRSQLEIVVAGKRVLPDVNGLERAKTLFKNQTPGNFRVVNEEPSPDVVVFEASMFVSNWNMTDEDEDNGTFSFTLTLAATPTVDTLD